MIGWLSGCVVDKSETGKIVIDAQGVGYDVETSLPTFFQLSNMTDRISLHIHTIVREDALLLYGFLDKQERALFRALIKVNGIGPKVAMSILSSVNPAEFVQCIEEGSVQRLTRLPGIGPKTAQRLLVEMKDKLTEIGGAASQNAPLQDGQREAVSALEALGYKPTEAARMIKAVDDGRKTCEQLIREALQRG